jgi:hypothetical protein
MNGVANTVAVLIGDTAQQIVTKIVNSPTIAWTGIDGGFKVIALGALVKFIAYIPGTFAVGTLGVAATGVTGSFVRLGTIGAVSSDNWIRQENWNTDRADRSRVLQSIDYTKGNIYDISYQWLGFGMITFRVENAFTGKLHTVHVIRYANSSTDLTIQNPNLPIYFRADNNAVAQNIAVQTGSCSLSIYGITGQTTGPRFSFSSMRSTSASGADDMAAGTLNHILSIRNLLVCPSGQGNVENVSELLILAINVSALLGTTVRRGGTFYVYQDAVFTNVLPMTWLEKSNTTSLVTTTNTTNTIVSGTELLAYPTGVDSQGYINTVPLEFYIRAGVTITIAYKPVVTLTGNANNSGDVGASITWVERI